MTYYCFNYIVFYNIYSLQFEFKTWTKHQLCLAVSILTVQSTIFHIIA